MFKCVSILVLFLTVAAHGAGFQYTESKKKASAGQDGTKYRPGIPIEAPPSNSVDATDSPLFTQEIMEAFNLQESPPFFLRLTSVGFASFSSFNGPSRGAVIPSDISNPIMVSPAVSILTDLNLFNSQYIVLETGIQYTGSGSRTGYVDSWSAYNYGASYGYKPSTDEDVRLSYLGVPIYAKYLFAGEKSTSFYIKAGLTANYLLNSQFTSYASGYTPYGPAGRYGNFSSFDLTFGGGVGVSWDLGADFHLVTELNGYHGVISVSERYQIYNFGFLLGAGIAFIL